MVSGSQATVKFVKRFGKEIVEKKAKYVDYSLELEHSVLNTVSKCDALSPYFPKSFGFKNRALLMEKIEGEELEEFAKRKWNSRNGKELIENVTLIAICFSELLRTRFGIVHNDLHTSNVLITKTDRDYFSFRLEGGTFSFKTFGYCPVIIDFGFAFSPKEKMLASPACTDIGYSIGDADPLADCRILLSSLSDTLKIYPKTKFTRYPLETFRCLNLDKNGWFQEDSFYDMLGEVMDVLLKDVDVEKFSGTIFDEKESVLELVVGLFIAQTVPNFIEESFDPEEIGIEFVKLASSLIVTKQFSKMDKKTQQLMLKDLLSGQPNAEKCGSDFVALAEPAREFSEKLSPLVNEILIANACSRDKMYSELSVHTACDVLNEIGKFKNCSKSGSKTRFFDFESDSFRDETLE